MATLSITVPDEVVPRIQDAVGGIRGLGGSASPAQVEREVKNYLHGLVMDWETKVEKDAIVVPPTGLEP